MNKFQLRDTIQNTRKEYKISHSKLEKLVLAGVLARTLELHLEQLKELIVVGIKVATPYPIVSVECQTTNLKYHAENVVCSNFPPTSVDTIMNYQSPEYFWKTK